MDANNDITMQYDSLDRLTTANGPWQNGSFTYDELGNRKSSVIGTNTATYDYDPVTNRLQNLTYDKNGNVTYDGYFNYTYDSENRLIGITNGTDVITYKYDGDGRRISQTVNGEKTVYAYGTGLNVLTEFNESGIPKVDYIYAGTTHIAREEFDINGNPVKKTFYHTDHLGSTKAITNLESTQIWKQGYLPYGGSYQNEVNPYDPTSTTHQYTGKEIEQSVGSSGTYYYGARYYRPDLGRFMSTDPGPVDITNPQSFNRYAYVLNNPYRYTDPDGACPAKASGSPFAKMCTMGGGGSGGAGPGSFPLKLNFGRIFRGFFRSNFKSQFNFPRSTQINSISNLGIRPNSQFVYDAKVGRFRDTSTGKFVSKSALPFPTNNGFQFSKIGTVPKGRILDRFGSLSGRFASEPGSSISQRGLASGTENLPYYRFEVLKPIEAEVGPAAKVPEFNANGGAPQYLFNKSIQQLIDNGFLEIIP